MSSNDQFVYPETYLRVKRQQEAKEQLEQLEQLHNSSTLKLDTPSSNHQRRSAGSSLTNPTSTNSVRTNQSNHNHHSNQSNQANHLNQLNNSSQLNHSNHSARPLLNQSSIEYTNLDLEDQSTYLNQSQRSSFVSLDDGEVINTNPKFIQDCSQYWYRPAISREDAIRALLNKPPGSFIVRDSDSFKGAYGLAVRVSQATAEQLAMQRRFTGKPFTNGTTELVRHFLIEPTSKGVRIRGCANEPVFSSLSALVRRSFVITKL